MTASPGSRSPWWGPVAGSIGFLTIVPMPGGTLSQAGLSRAIAIFPLVGALLGAVLGGLGLALDGFLPAGPVAALLLAAGVLMTGGLHLDGLMDTADGAFGGRSAEARLAIMRDSRVGAFGAMAGALVLLVQFACLSELTGMWRLFALVAAFTASRWALVLALGLFPSARPDGLGAAWHAAVSRPACIAASLLAAAAALALWPLGIAALATGAIVTASGGRWLSRRLGGLTGDACGALAAMTETTVLVVAVGLGAG
jgi:adenosylcobinamide-GDP ribazoletransferase